MINVQGGINGRKINLIQYDDAYSPPKAVEQVRKLVESDEVLLTFQIVGTPSNAAVQKYLNAKKVPQLEVRRVATGAVEIHRSEELFPWTLGFNPNYQTEGRIYGQYILRRTIRTPRSAYCIQNDDLGRDYLTGIKSRPWRQGGQDDRGRSLLRSDRSDHRFAGPQDQGRRNRSVLQRLRRRNQAAQAIEENRRARLAAYADRRHQRHFRPGAVLQPAGLEASKGLISTNYGKDPSDPQWKDDPGMKHYFDFMAKYYPEGDKNSNFNTYGYSTAQLMAHVLKHCGDDLTRENVIKQATNLKDVELDLSLPGMKANTTANDYRVNKQMQMMKFNGERWELFGPILEDAGPAG